MNDDRSRLRRSATEAFEDSLEQLKSLFETPSASTEEGSEGVPKERGRDLTPPTRVPSPEPKE
ncbi:MAG: hypothetical protein SVX43_02615 [Cyanobacteriota bacterium]|nr:hypothetical protein [Cyanobacteriota bacterium]